MARTNRSTTATEPAGLRRAWSGSVSRPGIAVLAALLACSGWLAGQRLYRGAPLRLEPPPDLLAGLAAVAEPAEFTLARMAYSDRYPDQPLAERPWMIDSPAAERHFLQGLRRLSAVDAGSKEAYVHPSESDFFDYPFLYVVEAGHWDLTDQEVERIREYLLRGGFMLFDDFHGSEEWEYFMRGMRRIFPSRAIEDLDPGHEIFHTLFDMQRLEQIPGYQMVFSHRTYERDGVMPHWRGVLDDDGRVMVLVNHNMDLGDAWEHADWPDYPERYTAMSYRLGVNYVVYAMTH